MTVTLVISTYNRPQALRLCLESAARQSTLPHEIVIADDGSGAPTRETIETFARSTSIPVRHCWQEDDGFRVAASRNRAIAAATGEYVIQIDGDILLEKHFIADHIAFARPGTYVTGARGYMSEELTRRVLAAETRPGFFSRGMHNRNNILHCPPLSRLYRHLGLHRRARGCNIAFWRDDLLRINGYDERFDGWGWEDTDLTARLENCGIRQQCLRFGGIGYHLHHPHAARPNLARNEALYLESVRLRTTRCATGLDRYL